MSVRGKFLSRFLAPFLSDFFRLSAGGRSCGWNQQRAMTGKRLLESFNKSLELFLLRKLMSNYLTQNFYSGFGAIWSRIRWKLQLLLETLNELRIDFGVLRSGIFALATRNLHLLHLGKRNWVLLTFRNLAFSFIFSIYFIV